MSSNEVGERVHVRFVFDEDDAQAPVGSECFGARPTLDDGYEIDNIPFFAPLHLGDVVAAEPYNGPDADAQDELVCSGFMRCSGHRTVVVDATALDREELTVLRKRLRDTLDARSEFFAPLSHLAIDVPPRTNEKQLRRCLGELEVVRELPVCPEGFIDP